MRDLVSSYLFTITLLSLLLYWAPMIGCAIGYAMRSGDDYRKDVANLADAVKANHVGSFRATLTVGVLLGRLFVSICPAWNLLAWIFDLKCAPFGRLVDWLEATFTFALVRPRKRT